MSVSLLTILITMLSPIIGILLFTFGFCNNYSRWKHYTICYAISMAMLAYCFTPSNLSDLYRYQSWTTYFNKSLLDTIKASKGLYVRDLLFWVVNKSGDKNILQAISTGMVYGVSSYITCDYCSKNNGKKSIRKILLIQFLLFPLLSIIDNVRNVLAFAIIYLAIYRDLYLKNRRIVTWILYILPCFLHPSSYSILLLRIVFFLLSDYYVAVAAVAFVFPLLINMAFTHYSLFSGIPVLNSLILSGNTYLTGGAAISAWAQEIAASNWQKVYKAVVLFYTVVSAIAINGIIKEKGYHDNEKTYFQFIFVICSITLATSAFMTDIYWRFGILVIFSLPTIMLDTSSKYIRSIKRLIVLQGVFCTLLWLYRLPSQVDAAEWIEKYLLCSPVYILSKNIIFR